MQGRAGTGAEVVLVLNLRCSMHLLQMTQSNDRSGKAGDVGLEILFFTVANLPH